MRTVCFYLTEQGHKTAEKLRFAVGCDVLGKNEFGADFKGAVKKAFSEYDGLVFVMAAGIVVRTIAPLLVSKTADPCVVVVDQNCEFAVSLLSGHIGGGNELARLIEEKTGARAVITTATDIQGVCAFDMFAKAVGAKIENIEVLKTISARMLDGKRIDFITRLDVRADFGENVRRADEYRGVPSVEFDIYKKGTQKDVLYIRPKCLYLGIGCKKGVSPDYMKECVMDFLNENEICAECICAVATVELKRHESAVNAVCEMLSVPLVIADVEKINECADKLECSEFVKSVTGAVSVAEGASYVASGYGTVIKGKTKYSGVTLALSREDKTYEFNSGEREPQNG